MKTVRDDSEHGKGRPAYSLEGTQLRIYVPLLESGRPMGVRDIARALDLSPSTVHYHLTRMAKAGLVVESGSGFKANPKASIEGFYYIAGRLIPRLTLFGTAFLGVTAGALVSLLVRGPSLEGALLVLTSLAASLVMLFEGLLARKRLFSG